MKPRGQETVVTTEGLPQPLPARAGGFYLRQGGSVARFRAHRRGSDAAARLGFAGAAGLAFAGSSGRVANRWGLSEGVSLL